jgi:hypothetical protein
VSISGNHYGKKVKHNKKAEWKKGKKKKKLRKMNRTRVRITETISFLPKTCNCKSPGSDKKNYWLATFPATYSNITKIINTIMEEPKQMANWLTTS